MRIYKSGEYLDYRDAIVLKKLGLYSVLTGKGKAGVFKLLHVFKKFRFCDILVWKVDLTVKIKLCFCDGLVWTVDLTVEIRFLQCIFEADFRSCTLRAHFHPRLRVVRPRYSGCSVTSNCRSRGQPARPLRFPLCWKP